MVYIHVIFSQVETLNYSHLTLICYPSTKTRIYITWVNFLDHKCKEIPLWPSRAQIQQSMPQCFRKKYPSTRVILDAKVMQPSDPIDPFLCGRDRLDEQVVVESRRISSLRIHVERAIERIKNYHFFR